MQRNSELGDRRYGGAAPKSQSWKGRSSSHDLTTQSGSNSGLGAPGQPISSTDFISSKTGYLTKRSIGAIDALANWRERFFVLAEGKLCYYKVGGGIFSKKKEEEQDLAHFKGQLELTSETVVKKTNIDNKANCFEINTGDKRMFAHANTIKECEDWIKSIKAHVVALGSSGVRGSNGDGSSPELKPTPAQVEASAFASNVTGQRDGPQDYSRPSLWDSHDIVRGAEQSSDPKDVVIKQLLEENRQLREQLTQKDQIIHQLETSGAAVDPTSSSALNSSRDTMSMPRNSSLARAASVAFGAAAVPKQMLDLRDLRKKQIQLFDAAEVGNSHLIATLLQNNVIDVNGVGINQYTALHLAARNNFPKAVAELCSRGADVGARTADRLTPLHLASMEGHAGCVEELLKAGADPNTTDQNGNGAVHLAAEGGNIACAKLLIAYGARTDVPNASGSLPLHISPIGHPIRVLLGSGDKSATPSTQPLVPPPVIDPTDDTKKTEMHVTFKNKYHESLALGPRDFEFIKVLGRGAFAKVYLVRGKGANRDKYFALKAYNKQAIVQKNQAQYIHTEKAALQACSDHPYIVSLYYAFQSQDRLFLVMEYCGGGDLLSTLTRRKAFTEPEAAFYIGQIVLALSHLHSKGIVFRDLKPENVVMDLDGNALLTDFGISKEGVADHSSANTFCGSPMYLAPEMLSRSGHGFPLDWYSVGALLFELLTGLPPYYTNDKKQLFHNILRGNLIIPEYISPQARDLIQRLLCKDPNQRLGSGPRGDKEIMEHPFFSAIDWGKLYRKEIPAPFKPRIDTQTANAPPDTSNFPTTFTEQEITEIEKGMAPPPQPAGSSSSRVKDEKRLFKDFDFTPEVKLDTEAALFEAQLLLHQNSAKNLKAPPLVESDEYSI
ncbi:AGC/RSK/RSK-UNCLASSIFIED protein kinase [Aphanomyces invadans]|uniref:AGC/RSK/RSK-UNCLASSIFIED protein kinase n=1 Tax=Aphanomyces invadans TaxID=157072 RepID=A0A024UT67_9STRA|nr:AGC/RSK/RSK-UNCLASSIFIED protein kinase [Aphanomyces invadans]ETW09150.1 AGC/RSK/RSK-UNCLASSIFIED protein kinase [Aphanomyces invadans]|eukprot:XP_008862955.1 AGC/RSK/RSK-UNCLASSIFIED protein kinase [Aphanomyces invadans]